MNCDGQCREREYPELVEYDRYDDRKARALNKKVREIIFVLEQGAHSECGGVGVELITGEVDDALVWIAIFIVEAQPSRGLRIGVTAPSFAIKIATPAAQEGRFVDFVVGVDGTVRHDGREFSF